MNFQEQKNIKINNNLDTHITKYRSRSEIPKDLELMLYNKYKTHNERLYKILGRKIEIWENFYKKMVK